MNYKHRWRPGLHINDVFGGACVIEWNAGRGWTPQRPNQREGTSFERFLVTNGRDQADCASVGVERAPHPAVPDFTDAAAGRG